MSTDNVALQQRTSSAFELDSAAKRPARHTRMSSANSNALPPSRHCVLGMLALSSAMAVFLAGYILGSHELSGNGAETTRGRLSEAFVPPGSHRRPTRTPWPAMHWKHARAKHPDAPLERHSEPLPETPAQVQTTALPTALKSLLLAGPNASLEPIETISHDASYSPTPAASSPMPSSAVPSPIAAEVRIEVASTPASAATQGASLTATASLSALPRRDALRHPCAPPRASSRLPGDGVYAGVALATWENLFDRRLGWREWRSIESFFWHHPRASLRLLSDTLPQDLLAPLRALGYDAAVERIDWAALKTPETAPVIDFWLARRDEVSRHPRYRAAKQADLVRLLFALQRGGLYFDLDTVFVAPLPAKLNFVTYWRGNRAAGHATNSRLPGAPVIEKVHNGIFGFSEPGSPFLRLVLPLFITCDGPPCPEPRAWAPGLTAPLLHPAWDSAGPPLFSRAVATMAPDEVRAMEGGNGGGARGRRHRIPAPAAGVRADAAPRHGRHRVVEARGRGRPDDATHGLADPRAPRGAAPRRLRRAPLHIAHGRGRRRTPALALRGHHEPIRAGEEAQGGGCSGAAPGPPALERDSRGDRSARDGQAGDALAGVSQGEGPGTEGQPGVEWTGVGVEQLGILLLFCTCITAQRPKGVASAVCQPAPPCALSTHA